MISDDAIERAVDLLAPVERVAVLTGAGVSAESGVPTFRASDGLWEGHRIEDVATPRGFRRDPTLVWRFYNARRANVASVQPNPGHHALVQLEAIYGDGFTLITQNVDGLHRSAGSRRLLEIHGNLERTRCTECPDIRSRGLEPLGDRPACPACGALLRPDIVWFEETLPEAIWEEALRCVAECEVLLVVGTSAVVHPAAGLIPLAARQNPPAAIIEINLTPTAATAQADLGLYGPSGEILPQLVRVLQARLTS